MNIIPPAWEGIFKDNMYKLIEVKPLINYKLFLKYSNGVCGEYDLKKIIGREDLKILRSEKIFNQVFVDKKTNDVCWPCGVNLCKNAIYRQIELKSIMNRLHIDLDKV
ncbi:DUF2442 domain-containing protein [Bacteroidota bacterium]